MNSTSQQTHAVPWEKTIRYRFRLVKPSTQIDFEQLQSTKVSKSKPSPTKTTKPSTSSDSESTPKAEVKKSAPSPVHEDVEKACLDLETEWKKTFGENNPSRFPSSMDHHLEAIAKAACLTHPQHWITSNVCERVAAITGISAKTIKKKLTSKRPKNLPSAPITKPTPQPPEEKSSTQSSSESKPAKKRPNESVDQTEEGEQTPKPTKLPKTQSPTQENTFTIHPNQYYNQALDYSLQMGMFPPYTIYSFSPSKNEFHSQPNAPRIYPQHIPPQNFTPDFTQANIHQHFVTPHQQVQPSQQSINIHQYKSDNDTDGK